MKADWCMGSFVISSSQDLLSVDQVSGDEEEEEEGKSESGKYSQTHNRPVNAHSEFLSVIGNLILLLLE